VSVQHVFDTADPGGDQTEVTAPIRVGIGEQSSLPRGAVRGGMGQHVTDMQHRDLQPRCLGLPGHPRSGITDQPVTDRRPGLVQKRADCDYPRIGQTQAPTNVALLKMSRDHRRRG